LNVLIVDDHTLFREGLRLLLHGLCEELDFDEAQGLQHIDRDALNNADLILLDLTTTDSTGIQTLQSIKSLDPVGVIVVISGESDPEVIRLCIDMGAAGFIPKNSQPPVLIAALRLVLAGGIYLPPECFQERSLENTASALGIHSLTQRQRHALLHAARGKSNKLIAREMNIAEGTVKLHLSAAYKTLGVNNRTEAVFLVSEFGLTEVNTELAEG